MKQINVLTLTLLSLLFSCEKKNSSPTSNPSGNQQTVLSDEEKNLIGRWVFIQATDTSYSDLEKKYTYSNLTQECMKDDVYTFNANKTYTKDAGIDSSCGKSHGEYEWSIDEYGFDFGGGPAITTKNGYIKIDDTHFAAQGRWVHFSGWSKKTYIFQKK